MWNPDSIEKPQDQIQRLGKIHVSIYHNRLRRLWGGPGAPGVSRPIETLSGPAFLRWPHAKLQGA